jgi:hypothetical protein
MEFEDVSEQIEWEARRVVAAFALETFWVDDEEHNNRDYIGERQEILVLWTIELESARFIHITVDKDGDQSSLLEVWPMGQEKQWDVYPLCHAHLDEIMARGLYRLGFEDEGVSSQLPHLSAHEKIELRKTMPCGFWPKIWLDEEGG